MPTFVENPDMHIPEGFYKVFQHATDVVIDSRKVRPGGLFLALKGSQVDGNTYAADALKRGAKAVVVDQPEVIPADNAMAANYWLVDDVLETLQALAAYHRSQLNVTVIGIAGSNGKTTTKSLIYHMLSQEFEVLATPGNWNNYIGLPLTLLQLKPSHQIAVLELGANQPGEYSLLCRMAQPTHGIITNIGLDHLEGYGDFQGVVQAHSEVTEYLKAHDGQLFVNMGDKAVTKIGEGLKGITYGPLNSDNGHDPDFKGWISERTPYLQVGVKPPEKSGIPSYQLATQLYGSYNFSNVMAAVSVAHTFGLSVEQVKKGAQAYEPVSNRSQQILQDGIHFILDAYNANPSSMREAIADFENLKINCRYAVLGDMHELGSYAKDEHHRILHQIKACTFTPILVGPNFYQFSEQFHGYFFKDMESLKAWWKQQSLKGCWVLLKGSRSMALETLLA